MAGVVLVAAAYAVGSRWSRRRSAAPACRVRLV
jgi:hypothetical protein